MVISWNLGPGNGQADGIRQADLSECLPTQQISSEFGAPMWGPLCMVVLVL
jgi:hypothetical protein